MYTTDASEDSQSKETAIVKWVPPVTDIDRFRPEMAQKVNRNIHFSSNNFLNHTGTTSKSLEELDDTQKIAALKEEVQKLTDALEQAKTYINMFEPIISAYRPEVHFVPVDLLRQLDEYRQDATRWWTIAGMLLGVLLSIMGNIATGATLSTATWVIVLLAGAMGSFAAWQAIIYDRRAKKLSDKIMTKPTAP